MTTSGEGNEGAVSAIVLCFGCPAVVVQNGTASILAASVDWEIPAGGGEGSLEFVGGLQGEGQPVDLVVTEDGKSAEFATETLNVSLSEVVSCCNAEYNVGFASAADGDLLDDSDACSGSGSLTLGGGGTIYASVRSDSDIGLQGWSFGVQGSGDLSVDAVTTEGTTGIEVFNGGFNKTSLATDEGVTGGVTAVVLCFGCPAVIPNGAQSLLAVTVSGPVPSSGGIRFAAGLTGEGQPVDNVFTENGASAEVCNLATASLDVTFDVVGLGAFLRGDANDDGKVNIADPIWIINELFREGPATGCQVAADANADELVTLADAMYLIDYRFLGGAAPSAPFPECGTVEAAGDLTCDAAQSSCN